MAEARVAPAFEFSAELAEFDPEKWQSKAHWHLARCYALPRRMKQEKIAELRASCSAS